MDEAALLKSAKKFDREALITIFDIYAPRVYRYCFRLCGNPVQSDHFVGEIFSRLWEYLAAVEVSAVSLKSYIFLITYQTMINREEGVRRPRSMGASPMRCVQTNFGLESSENQDQSLSEIISAIDSNLTASQRHVLLLRFLEEFSLQETALIEDKNVSNVKVIQNRAIVKLRKILDAVPRKSVESPMHK